MKKKFYLAVIALSLLLCLVNLPFGILCIYFLILFYLTDSSDTSSSFSLSYPYLSSIKNENSQNFTSYDYDDYQIIDFLNRRRADKVSEIENTGLTESEHISLIEIALRLEDEGDSPEAIK